MLKIKNGIVIQGRFDAPEEGLVKLVREASFSTIIIHSRLKVTKTNARLLLIYSQTMEYNTLKNML